MKQQGQSGDQGSKKIVTSPPDHSSQETFVARAIRLFKEDVFNGFSRANKWRRKAAEWWYWKVTEVQEQLNEHMGTFILALTQIIWVSFTIWFRLTEETNGLIWMIFVGIAGGPSLACVIVAAAFLMMQLCRVLTQVISFFPLVLWVPIYALAQATVVVGKLSLLFPLAVLFGVTRLSQIWRRIFYTCPSRHCSYRGLPAYVCEGCGHANYKLWPNLYGLLWHHCRNCDQRLPTLDLLNRNRLSRLCGDPPCRMPLLGKHAGKVPERLVAIVGAPSSGKTNYLLMAVNAISNGKGTGKRPLRGEIDDATQAQEFRREWPNLAAGIPADKTSAVTKAVLLYVKMGHARYQLYLYDAPGEEFSLISAMSQQQYFSLLEGFILLVDPLSLASSPDGSETSPFQDVVASTIATASAGAKTDRNGRLPMRVAVVISKADEEQVRSQIGDIREGAIAGEGCREAIMSWGGGLWLLLLLGLVGRGR